MARVLEVIVTSVEDAIEAEAGGADRLELVRALEIGGLTPEPQVAQAILRTVRIPVRIMLRDTATMLAGDVTAIANLQRSAESFARHPIDGLVAGFTKAGAVDIDVMRKIVSAAPACHITFHRAIDEVVDPFVAIRQLKEISQVDRILTAGGSEDWARRRRRLMEWKRAAEPEIQLLIAVGLCPFVIADLKNASEFPEIHVGRAARVPQAVSGAVSREAVRLLKSALL